MNLIWRAMSNRCVCMPITWCSQDVILDMSDVSIAVDLIRIVCKDTAIATGEMQEMCALIA